MTTRRASPAPSGGYSYRPPNPTIVQRALKRLWNNPPKDFSSVGSLGCIAVSIYHEARNQPIAGQAAVATVILNRAANPERWGGTPCGVVQPVQFSYLRPDRSFAPITNLSSWNEALEIAAEVLKRGPDPKLEGADHYHATYVNPPWNQKMDWIAQIKDHIFWRSRPTPL
ncbi:MAG: cell wall hydrolase [Mangrovicoccus sp.]